MKIIPSQCPICKKSYVPIISVANNGKKELICIDCFRKKNAKQQETP